jgi:hypothetical protein
MTGGQLCTSCIRPDRPRCAGQPSADPSAQPRIWITPPRYVVTTVDELAKAIAPYEVVPLPVEMIKVHPAMSVSSAPAWRHRPATARAFAWYSSPCPRPCRAPGRRPGADLYDPAWPLPAQTCSATLEVERILLAQSARPGTTRRLFRKSFRKVRSVTTVRSRSRYGSRSWPGPRIAFPSGEPGCWRPVKNGLRGGLPSPALPGSGPWGSPFSL